MDKNKFKTQTTTTAEKPAAPQPTMHEDCFCIPHLASVMEKMARGRLTPNEWDYMNEHGLDNPVAANLSEFLDYRFVSDRRGELLGVQLACECLGHEVLFDTYAQCVVELHDHSEGISISPVLAEAIDEIMRPLFEEAHAGGCCHCDHCPCCS